MSVRAIMQTEHSKYPSAPKLKPHQNCFDMHSYGNDSFPPPSFHLDGRLNDCQPL